MFRRFTPKDSVIPLSRPTAACAMRMSAGEMANGITSVRMVTEMGKAGMLGFFGAGGLMPQEVEAAVDRLQREDPRIPFGVNLIHSPGQPELEMTLAELFSQKAGPAGQRLRLCGAQPAAGLLPRQRRAPGSRRAHRLPE